VNPFFPWTTLLASTLVILPVAKASVPGPLQLEDVLKSIDRHYPLIQAARSDQERARGDLTAARGGFDPILKSSTRTLPSGEYENRSFDLGLEQATPLWGTRLFAGYRQGEGKFAPYDEKLVTNSEGEWRVGFGIPLLRGGVTDERRARIASAEQGLGVADAAAGFQRLEARRQGSHRYFDWVAAGEKLKVARTLRRLAVDRDQAMRARVQRGDSARIEQVYNQRSVNQREAGVVAAERVLERAAFELSLFHRNAEGHPDIPSENGLPLNGFSDPPEARTEAAITAELLGTIQKHPEVQRLEASISQNQVDQTLARNLILPRLDAELETSRDFGEGKTARSTPELRVGVFLEFPLFFRTGLGRSDSAAAQGVRLEAQLDLVRDRLRTEVSNALRSMEAAAERVRLTREEVELSIRVEDAERLRFRQGDSTILMVNLREQATADAQSRLIDALADFHRAGADLEAAKGELPPPLAAR